MKSLEGHFAGVFQKTVDMSVQDGYISPILGA